MISSWLREHSCVQFAFDCYSDIRGC